MDRFYYQNSIAGFLADSEDAILGALARNNTFDLVDLQRNAWLYEIRLLKDMLRAEPAGQVVFEYSIPRLGKRIDVVLLLHGIVFVLEFKVGAEEYLRQDLEQVWDYALDLKNFHEASRDLTIVPILVATDADNASVIEQYDNKDMDVTLAGRTLYKDGKWNTICLPFDLNISGSILDGNNVDVRTLSSSNFDHSTGVLTLNFTSEGDVTKLDAGTPYIIKWSKTNESDPDLTNLVNPTFKGVTINNTVDNVNSTYVQFIGTYSPIIWESENKSILLVGGNNLYYPQPSGGQNPRINAFRAYFQLVDTNAPVMNVQLNFGDGEATSLSEELRIKNDEGLDRRPEGESQFAPAAGWFTINGVKLSGQPTQKGLYIHNGRKVVVK